MLSEKYLLDVDLTLCCGQVFRWKKTDDWWYGVTGERVFKIRQNKEKIEYTNVDFEFIEQYFGLKQDLEKILININKDTHINEVIRQHRGLRLIRQDPWECLISYICATCKSIPAIKHMLNNMAKKFGQETSLDGQKFYTFPKPEQLKLASEQDLISCGLGYRAKYLLNTVQTICKNDFDLDTLKKMPYLKAKKQLMEFSGVGAKVADCVCLFSLEKNEAFPVDIWVKRVILNHYSDKLPKELYQKLTKCESLCNGDYERLNTFGRNYFGKYAGYAQEYLYHWERTQL